MKRRDTALRDEDEQPEAERLPPAELDVAAAAVADPGQELVHARLVGMRGGVALTVPRPGAFVAVEVVDARDDGVERRQAELLSCGDCSRVVGQLVAGRVERLEVGGIRLATPVAVAVE